MRNDITKNMSPYGAALFNALTISSDPSIQIAALDVLRENLRPVPQNPQTHEDLKRPL